MAAFRRTELDLVGLARKDNQAAIQLFAVRNGQCRRARCLPARCCPRRARRGGPRELPRAVLRPRDVDPAPGPRPVPAAGAGGSRGVPRRAAGRAGPPPRPAARRAARADGSCDPQRVGDARPRAGPLAGRRGQDLAALEQLRGALELPGPPFRIECYDISNVQGSDSVGSMVVFEEGRPRTGEYRRFKIRTVVGANDFASHQEVPAAPVPAGPKRGGGERRGAPLGDAGPRRHRRRQGPGRGGQGGPRRDGPPRPAARRDRQGARGAVPAPAVRPRRPAVDVERAVPHPAAPATRPTASRSPTTATCGRSARPTRRSTTCPASARSGGGAAAGLRIGEARPRGAGRADRRPCPGSGSPGHADQGNARGSNVGGLRVHARFW